MIRCLLYMLICLPSFAVSQKMDDRYLEQKLDEARRYHRQFDYEKSQRVLDSLYLQAVTEQNDFAAALSLMKKVQYAITNGDFTSVEPKWSEIAQFRSNNRVRNDLLKIHLLKLKATWYQSIGTNYPEAFFLLDEGIRIAGNSAEYQPVLAEIHYLYGQLKAKNSQYVEASSYFLNALRIYDQLDDEEAAGQLYGELANTSFLMGEQNRAIDYAKKGIEAMENQKDYEELTVQLSNLARIYQLSGDTDNAIRYFAQSAAYASKSVRKETRFISLVDLALVYHARKDREHALNYMEQAINEGRKIGQPKLHRYIRMGAMFAGYVGNEELMNRYYDESYALAMADNDRDALRDWHGSQNFYYANVKKDKATAYPFLEKFHAYKDSIVNENSRRDFNELEVQYQTEKKQAEIERLAAGQKIQLLELQAKNALLRGSRIEAAQKEKEIAEQEKAIRLKEAELVNLQQQQKIAVQDSVIKEERIQNEQLKRNLVIALLLVAVILFVFVFNRTLLKKKLEQKTLLLKERSRISSELHDEVGSTLTAINLLSYATLNQLSDPAQKRQVEKIKENTQSVMENIGDIVWSINPENQSFGQLILRMKEFAGNLLDPQHIQYRFRVDDGLEMIRLSPENRRDLYLIFKEAAHNMAKYAKATTAEITLSKSVRYLVLEVKDDGVGFDATTVNSGNGLKNMKARTEKHGGIFQMESGDGGTVVTIYYPYA